MATVGVVGGGIIGASCASHLAERGHSVTVYERDAVGSGTTRDSMAVFLWQEVPPKEAGRRFRTRSWDEYRKFVEDDALEYTRTGTAHVAWSEKTLEHYREYATRLREFGVDADVRETIPPFADGRIVGALVTPEDGYLDPVAATRHYAAMAESAGAEVRTDAPVTDVVVDGREESVDAVVNAAGPWAPAVDDWVGVSVPLSRTAGPIVAFDADVAEQTPFALFENELYVRPYDGGVYVGHYDTTYDESADVAPDRSARPSAAFRREARELLSANGVSVDGVDDEYVGYRTVTPDGFPLVGETGVSGYYVATGMSGLGVTRAPAVGQALAAAVDGEADPLLERVSPSRFER